MPSTKEELDEKLEKLDIGVDYRAVVQMIESSLQDFADANAAMAWSTPGDELTDEFGDDVFVIASFGSYNAVNGDVTDSSEDLKPPKGFKLTNRGGRIPVAEEEVPVEQAIYAVSKEIPKDLAFAVAEAEGMKELAYISVSGESEVWAKKRE